MPRPRKSRKVVAPPKFVFFKPAGVPLTRLEDSIITVGEYEALRLADLEGKQQKDVAENMGISQPTLNRLLSSARKKLADALVNGKAIKIEGGTFELISAMTFRCMSCSYKWDEKTGTKRPSNCPKCGNDSLKRLS